MVIQWYPGHMEKARREVEEKLKLVDFVMELVDARAPLSSKNPMLERVVQDKTSMIVLMKADLADRQKTLEWMNYFQEQGMHAIAIDVNNKDDIKKVIQMAKDLGEERMAKLRRKGIKPRPVRAMVVGIPNVGKSTLINRLAGKKIAKTGDRPAVTNQQLWIKVKNEFELLDTPGILWPKFEDEIVGYRLAALGTIKDQLLSLEDISAFIITFMQKHYPKILRERFAIDQDDDDMLKIFNNAGKRRGCLESGGSVNFEKVASIILGELRTGKLGRVTLEPVDE